MDQMNIGCEAAQAHRDWDCDIDEDALNYVDRLGLAYCRLNSWIWDPILGAKPIGFDSLPDYDRKEGRLFHRKRPSKSDYVEGPMTAIEQIIGPANIDRCWWKFRLKKTEAEWFAWYVRERFSPRRSGSTQRQR